MLGVGTHIAVFISAHCFDLVHFIFSEAYGAQPSQAQTKPEYYYPRQDQYQAAFKRQRQTTRPYQTRCHYLSLGLSYFDVL